MLFRRQLSSDETLTLFTSGKPFFDELERLIDSAEREIHLQVYILDGDATGMRILNALVRAAGRGVKVFLIIDGYGSLQLSSATITGLQNAGIRIKFYGPLIRQWHFHIGRRLHRKVTVIDEKIGIVTGLNISNHYHGQDDRKAWLDFAVVVQGPVVSKLHDLCLRLWFKKPIRKRLMNRLKRARVAPVHSQVRVRQNDWLRGLNEANATYRREIGHAQKSLFIVGGYFLPGGRVRRKMKRAIERGVKIQLIIAAQSDVTLMRNAMLYLYRWMLRNKIDVFEYLPANVHGKVLIADHRLVSMGSYDLNNLSTYSNIELNLDIEDNSFASAFQEALEKIALDDCRLITFDDLHKRESYWRMFKHWMAYQIVKSLFILSLKLSTRDEEES